MSAWKNAMIVAAMAAFSAAGCQSKMAQENRALWQQNRELQSQNTALANQPKADPTQVAQLQAELAQRDQQLAAYQQQSKRAATQPASEQDFAGMETSYNRATGDVTVTLPGDVLFDAGRAALRDSAKITLAKVARTIRGQYAGRHIYVDGYSDSDPINKSRSMWRDNLDLSAARARAVANYLQSQGIHADNMQIRAFGPAKLKATKEASRRVELVVATR